MDNRPQGREKNVTGHSGGVHKRGDGLGTGPVGSQNGYSGRTGQSGKSSGPSRAGKIGGGGGLIVVIIILFLIFGKGCGGNSNSSLSDLSGLTDSISQTTQSSNNSSYYSSSSSGTSSSSSSSSTLSSLMQGFNYSSLFSQGSSTAASATSSSGWLNGSNTGKLNTNVSGEAREKRTQILGNGKDTVTVMLYMCGTDLESKSAMATKDLQEMLNATISDKINYIIFTGGCTRWQNNVVSSSVNQIYKLTSKGLTCLESNAGTAAMTSPDNLASFIKYCAKNYPANRNMLILWDHGGGSISGYGYDEKNQRSGSMTLKGLNEALKAADTEFDFIGFDACLMATLETGLTMAPYADYLIASEETEPGLGWYYTGWITALSENTSISTLELGRKIVDDFVTTSAQSCPGQKTTLSVTDLAELEKTVPDDFTAFASSTLDLLKNDGYQTVSDARSSVREFAASSKIDQIDLVHMALKLDTEESRALADTILDAVKYNRTSSDITNAYGLSLYFPYQKVNNVSNAVATYDAIDLDDTYTACIRTFASLEASGQAAAGGYTSPLTALSGQSYGSSAVGSSSITDMLSQMLGGTSSFGSSINASSFFDRSLDMEKTAQYLTDNRFDADALIWQSNGDGYAMQLTEEQWAMVQNLELNVFVDDGEGYIDLGLDNVFEFTEDGKLVGAYDGTWLAIDDQIVAYYHVDTTVDENGDYVITGRVPVLLNGDRADLIIVFTSDNPYGYIAGARTDYRNGETETVAKGMTDLAAGDTIDFVCDYYSYDGIYEDSYLLGEQHIYTGSEEISNLYTDSDVSAMYLFTDMYHNTYWTPEIPTE